MVHPAVVKATKIANHAVAQGWKGQLSSEPLSDCRKTILNLTRNDEELQIVWRNSHFNSYTYKMFKEEIEYSNVMPSLKSIIFGWPDVLELFEMFPLIPRPTLSKTYVRLPFSVTDDNQTIMNRLVGRRLFWWDHREAKRRTDVVLLPKRQSGKQFSIKEVGHRKLMYFYGTEFGWRHILLDTILKVA